MKKNCENTINLDRKIGQIMEINVNSTKLAEVLTCVEEFVSHSRKFYIVTPNPELILMAQSNKSLKDSLNAADISVPDGVGLKIANPDLKIIKGRELFLELIKLAVKKKWKVFLLGGLGDEAAIAKLKIENSMENEKWKMEIKSASGPKLSNDAKPITKEDERLEKEVINQINTFNPELLFVAFGNPKQEIWIHDNISRIKIGGAMCIGGTLRYVAGLSKLPPEFVSSIGLEWLWRLFTEPKRIGRIFRAVVVFPIKYLISKF